MDSGASLEGAIVSATPERESAPMPGSGLDTDASGVIQIGRGIDDVFAHNSVRKFCSESARSQIVEAPTGCQRIQQLVEVLDGQAGKVSSAWSFSAI